MRECGNRDKASRFYKKKKDAKSDKTSLQVSPRSLRSK
jgi:hypothetical protein